MSHPIHVDTALPPSHRDLLEAAGVAVLGTIGPGGRPQLSAVWYLLDDDGLIKVSVRGDRQKIRNLNRRPEATFFLIDPANPMRRTLEVRATAEVTPDEGYAFADRVGAKYGVDLHQFDQPDDRRFVVTLQPDRVNYRG
jgi:PPOX class probable F420-dependent enzyme